MTKQLHLKQISGDDYLFLKDFARRYEEATNSHIFEVVSQLIDREAVYWFSDGSFSGIAEIKKAFENAWKTLPDEMYMISNMQWIAVSDKTAACIYDFHWKGTVNGKVQEGGGRGTNVLKKVKNQWKIVHEHLSK